MVWRELEEGLRGQGRTCQCGQGEHTDDPDLGQSADLTAGMVAEAGPESPPQDAKDTVLEKALTWSSAVPRPPNPTLTPPERRQNT